mmetsp:Transcript_14627/g.32032  ORF Transcript_14627/g.32032 Transcript_14627/m.32032 type:complete len:357 (-) Transcript_14627:143-1213(-)
MAGAWTSSSLRQRALVAARASRGLRCLQVVTLSSIGLCWLSLGRTFLAPGAQGLSTRSSGPFEAQGLAAPAGILAAALSAPAAWADEPNDADDFRGYGLYISAFLVVIGAVLSVLTTDTPSGSVDDKKVVEEYFNGEGFSRWQKIYGETEDVNPVQKDIRVGHAETVDKILNWLDSASIDGKTVCDAGCGTGNLSIPLASRGALVTASDISKAMVTEAASRAESKLKGLPGVRELPSFEARDLESIEGDFNTVCCVDVLIHYPPEKMEAMVGSLAGRAKERLILSFAPKTWYYVLLKRIGELFPGKSKTTRAYLHEEEAVEAALKRAGFQVFRRELTATNFYFSRLFEAKPIAQKA